MTWSTNNKQKKEDLITSKPNRKGTQSINMTHGPLGQPITAHSRNLKLPNYPYSRKALLKLNQQLSKLKNLILDSIITKITYERCQESLILKLDQKS